MASLNLKLQLGTELRKSNKLPKTLTELRDLTNVLFNKDTFSYFYKDLNGELIPITSDANLKYAYDLSRNKPSCLITLQESPDSSVFARIDSLRQSLCEHISPSSQPIEKTEGKRCKKSSKKQEACKTSNLPLLAIHEGIICNECKISPIAGIRYKCISCPDFNLCECCEDILDHPHPVIKLRTPMKNPKKPIVQPESIKVIKEIVASHVKDSLKKKFKAKIKQYLVKKGLAVMPGVMMKLGWELINKGKKSWPDGSKVVMKKGDIQCNEVVLPKVEPGEKVVVEVMATLPSEEKDCQGVWEIVAGDKRFGKICAQVRTVADQKLRELINMGADHEKAKTALEVGNGDLALAMRYLQRL